MRQYAKSRSRVGPGGRFGRLRRWGALAVVVGLLLPLVPATAAAGTAVPAPTSAMAEAEWYTVTPGAGAVVSAGGASSGRAVMIWSNGSLSGSIRPATPGTSSSIVIRARGAACLGAPSMTVTVDGRVLGSRSVASSDWTDYRLASTLDAGSHTVEVRFDNDYLGSGCDRNLYLDTIRLESAAVASPPASCAFGLSQGDGANRGLDGALATAAALGRTLQEFNFYMAWTYDEPFPADVLAQARAHQVLPSITWEPWDPSAGVEQPRFRLATIAAGAFDGYIDRWARAAAAYAGPVKIRFAHEMNGSWYPWSAAANGNSPATYVAAFRHVQDRFDAAGATNVIWVWSPNVVTGMPIDIKALWPGGRYVDAIGVDGYNGGTDEPSMGGWRTPRQVFGDTLAQLDAIAPATPVYLAETASAEGGGDKAGWIRELSAYVGTTRVSGVDWFEFPGRADWRLTSSRASIDAARAVLCTG